MIASLADASFANHPLLVKGGGGSEANGYVIVAGPPVYDYYDNCLGLVSILDPANGTVFYFPNISPNITFYLENIQNPACSYATTGGWNNFTCAQGNTTKIVTLPEGLPLTVTFRVNSGNCVYSTDIKYMVHYRPGYATTDAKLVLAAAISTMFVFLLAYLQRRRRKRL